MNRIKILVVQHKQIGDVLASTVICETIKRQYPEATIHYLINTNTIPVVWNHPSIDEIIEFKPAYQENSKFMKGFIKAIKNARYDVVIDAYCKLRSSLLSFRSKAPIRISYDKWYSRYFYTKTVKRRASSQTIASIAIENRLALVLKPEAVNTNICKPKIYLNSDERKAGEVLLKEHGLSNGQLLMLNLFGSSESKSYPVKYMHELIKFVADKVEANFLINVMPGQRSKAQQLVSELPVNIQKKIHLEVPMNGLRQFLILLNQCGALIGNEGGATNMAKALGIPSFGIFSPWVDQQSWNIFEDGVVHQSVHLQQFKPELFENKGRSYLLRHAARYYDQFTPELIIPKLTLFCQKDLSIKQNNSIDLKKISL